ncbi:hypothetical protein GCM10010151_64670 [Actinoallomurus spadix]|uniref:Uncharacterized protein n=1 Tax=Actinoallomurus spadix TaxID=79912 RepID=A0ABP3H9Y0_9ACTN
MLRKPHGGCSHTYEAGFSNGKQDGEAAVSPGMLSTRHAHRQLRQTGLAGRGDPGVVALAEGAKSRAAPSQARVAMLRLVVPGLTAVKARRRSAPGARPLIGSARVATARQRSPHPPTRQRQTDHR